MQCYIIKTTVAPVWMNFEPIGAKYYQQVYQLVHGLTVSRDGHVDDASDSGTSGSEEENEQVNSLLLDPTQWKVAHHQPPSFDLCSP